MLQQIRDEAHRFAVTFQQQKRSTSLKSRLEEIPGVGEVRRQELLKRFGSVSAISNAAIEEVSETAGIGRKLAETILKSLSNNEKKPSDKSIASTVIEEIEVPNHEE